MANPNGPLDNGAPVTSDPGVYSGRRHAAVPASQATHGGHLGGGFSLFMLFRTILRRWITVLLFTFLGTLLAGFYIQNATPMYKAKAVLEMNVRRPKVIKNEAVFEDPTSANDADAIFNTRFEKFRSPAMESLAAKEYLTRYPEHQYLSTGQRVGRYSLSVWMRDVSWYKDPEANIVYVTYYSVDPEFAAQLVNVISYCAGVLMAEENKAQSDEAVKWLIEQADNKRKNLEEVEQELSKERQKLQLDSLEQRKKALDQAIVTVTAEKETLLSKLGSKKTVYDFVKGLKNSEYDLEMLPSGLPKEAEFNELIRDWRQASENLYLAAERYTEIHPEYKKISEIEARSRKRLGRFIDMSALTLKNEVELIELQVGQTDERISAMKQEAIVLELDLSRGLSELQRLERKREAADASYQAMLRRMEEARLSSDENMAFTKVIRTAHVPQIPVSPKKVRVLLLGTVAGGLFGSMLVLLMAFWTDKINCVADLKVFNLRILATMPSQKKLNARHELATIGLRDKFNCIVEIFSGINTVITSGTIVENVKVVLMTSAGPGEGKTISACNLAISSAMNGSRTLLIDGDLRRPNLRKVFDIHEEHFSFLEWLKNPSIASKRALVSEDLIENLDLITSRPDPDTNPVELLGRNELKDFIEWARGEYDRVIIDSPPIGAVGDAQVLGSLSDTIIFVARAGKTKKRFIRFGLARLAEINTPLLGCIANDVPHSLAGMFGGAEGYGAYGYGNYKM